MIEFKQERNSEETSANKVFSGFRSCYSRGNSNTQQPDISALQAGTPGVPARKRLLEPPLSFDDFPAEPIPADEALAHGLERLLLILASDMPGRAYRLPLRP